MPCLHPHNSPEVRARWERGVCVHSQGTCWPDKDANASLPGSPFSGAEGGLCSLGNSWQRTAVRSQKGSK